jgi:hypothetical protein
MHLKTKPVLITSPHTVNRMLGFSDAGFHSICFALTFADPAKSICTIKVGGTLYLLNYATNESNVTLIDITRLG